MKRRILFFLLILTLILALASCGEDSNKEGGRKEPVDYGSATVYAPGDNVQLISADRAATKVIEDALSDILTRDGGAVQIGSLYSQNEKLEILFGIEDIDGSRPIIEKAGRYLSRVERESIFEMRYVIYAEAGQIAFVYDTNEYTNLQPMDAIAEIFAERFLVGKSYFAAASGIVASGTVDLIEMQRELDADQLQESWAKIEKTYGREVADAFRVLYSMYDTKMVEWAANLYDPGVGGFYTCATGRDSAEFGPDVECTVQILRFISKSGMVDNCGGYLDYIPKAMQQQMIYFAKSLQDPKNGYFYHPQWGKDATDAKLSRRGRDLGWATSLLSMFGSAPTFNAPNGTRGDGITADDYWDSLEENGEALSSRPYSSTESPTASEVESRFSSTQSLTKSLGDDMAEAISKVMLASTNPEDEGITDASTEYLKSHKAFVNYLITTVGPSMDSNPYSGGNNLNATYSQIKNASDQLGVYTYTAGDEAATTNTSIALAQFRVNGDSDGSNDMTITDIYRWFDGMNLSEMTIYFLNEKINPDIGLWGVTSATNPTGTEFLFTNGFFKTITLYNSWGFSYPVEYIDDAANALTDGLLGDQPSTGNICEVYNIWSAIGSLKSNLKKYVDPSVIATDASGNIITDSKGNPVSVKDKVMGEVNEILNSKLAEALLNTHSKISGYKNSDGGFDHAYERSNGGYTTQQGMPTGYSKNDMSNIDATCIGTTGLVPAIFTAIGNDSLFVPIFTEADWMVMLEIFLELTPVIKHDEMQKVEILDFEDDLPAEAYFKVKPNSTDTTYSIKTEGENSYFNLSAKTSYTGIYVYNLSSGAGGNVAVFESDFCLTNLTKAAPIQIWLCGSSTSNANKPAYIILRCDGTKDGSSNVYMQSYHNGALVNGYDGKAEKINIAKVGEWFKLRFEYRIAERGTDGTATAIEIRVYVNGQLVLKNNALYGTNFKPNGGSLNVYEPTEIKQVIMNPNTGYTGDLRLDNTFLKTENSSILADAPGENRIPEPPKVVEEITFDEMPDSKQVSFTHISELSTHAIVTEGENKCMKISSVDKASYMYSYPLIDNANADAAIFETDVKMANLTSKKVTQIFIRGGTDSRDLTPVYLILNPLGTDDGSIIEMNLMENNDYVQDGDGNRISYPIARVGEWFKLRIEYRVTGYDGEGKPLTIETRVYVNDKFIFATDIVNGSGFTANGGDKPVFSVSEITRVVWCINTGYVGDMLIDNVSFHKIAKAADPLPEPHEHEYVEGECHCGLLDPNYVPPHKHIYVDGRCECGELDPEHEHEFIKGECVCGEVDPNYVPPHEHEYDNGWCDCGAFDPDHEHSFVKGECACGEVDPNYVPPHEHEFINGECACGAIDPSYVPELDIPTGGTGLGDSDLDDGGWVGAPMKGGEPEAPPTEGADPEEGGSTEVGDGTNPDAGNDPEQKDETTEGGEPNEG